MRATTRALTGLTALGVGTLAYSAGYEVRAYTLRRVEVPVLPAGSPSLRVLHLSDVHLTPDQGRKRAWVAALADLRPDLVVHTGDNLGHLDALPPLLRCYDRLLDVPGVFVLGSNDYFSPVLKNPLRYLWRHSGGETARRVPDLPHVELRRTFADRGWVDLSNATGRLSVNGLELAFAGVDDPHLGRADLAAVAGPAPDADLAVGVAHAPYLGVLDAFATDGYRLLMAGHTHGGQLRVPGYGALVTNCDLDRQRARGLHPHPAPGRDDAWLHVSGGLGTSPFAPVRFDCRPEATLLTLTA